MVPLGKGGPGLFQAQGPIQPLLKGRPALGPGAPPLEATPSGGCHT